MITLTCQVIGEALARDRIARALHDTNPAYRYQLDQLRSNLETMERAMATEGMPADRCRRVLSLTFVILEGELRQAQTNAAALSPHTWREFDDQDRARRWIRKRPPT